MKRLIISFDGTWNNPDQEDNGVPAPTNVVKIHNAISDQDGSVKQLRYYHSGLGGEGGMLKPMFGGAVGAGISRHICSAYHWLGKHYKKGDEIYLFGFSRGAFTVRSIAGFLGLGLLSLQGLESKESWRRVHKAYNQGYRKSAEDRSEWVEEDWVFVDNGNALPIRFLGVWDTVGALGVPDDLEILNLLDNKKKWQFHNTDLGDHIRTARHAMALDEMRSSFTVCRWSNASRHGDAKEVWFPGVHSDVGGGYAETDLSNGALLWMIAESATAGLKFRDNIEATINENPLGVMHNSLQGVFKKFRSRPRNIDAIIPANRHQFHANVFKRQAASPIDYEPYRPTTVLAINETSVSIDIFANNRWNYTGIYLEKGSYRFSAEGEWVDKKDACDWEGTEDGNFSLGDVFRSGGSAIGMVENLFKKFSGNKSTDFGLTKRAEDSPWFCMVGAITNDGLSEEESSEEKQVKNDGSPIPHQYVNLSKHKEQKLMVTKPGYLFCFANDAWSMYGNNSGSVQLTVQRIQH